MKKKKIKNPLIRRIPRELTGDWKKYLVVSLFLILMIGFVSGMYVANESMMTAADEGVGRYKLEDGHFELKKKADETLLDAIKTGDKADVRQYYIDEAKKKLDKKFDSEFEEKFKQLVIEMFSFMDVGKNTAENFYHAFVLGMLVGLKDSYYVKLNRESGFGRYDIMLEPKDKNENSFVMEFKVYKEEKEKTIEDTIENAKKQIEERKYAEDLEERGYTNITKMVFAFKGKEVKMQVI